MIIGVGICRKGGRKNAGMKEMNGDDQFLCDPVENPVDITRTSAPVLSRAAPNFLPRLDPGLASLFHNFDPWEGLSVEAECGTVTGALFNPIGGSGTDREVLLVWPTRVGMGSVVGGGGLWSDSTTDSGDTDT